MRTALPRRAAWLRLFGLGLLAVLLWQVDLRKTWGILQQADLQRIALSFGISLLLILLKTWRWQVLLRAQSLRYDLRNAYLAFWGSLFIGLLTPGRLGELVKSLHVSRDLGVPSGQAFSSVLADRLFDLGLLVVVGNAALLRIGSADSWFVAPLSILLIFIPMSLFIYQRTFASMLRLGSRLGRVGRRLFADDGWLVEMRRGLLQLSGRAFWGAVALTVLAYAVFFEQCYLLAQAVNLPVGYVPVMYAVALGSLITLVPVSISGMGTRDAAIIAYLGTSGVGADAALSFSLLVFAVFYLGSGVIGAVAWWLKPVQYLKRS